MTFCEENNTFKFGENIDLNACVGKNGINDINTYEYGFDLAVNILIDAAKKDTGIVDQIIYPLLFSARHRIELCLKKSIIFLEDINKIRGKTYNPVSRFSHDIVRLWSYVKELSFVDSRYLSLIDDLSPLIEDYRIDSTGTTFRYPYSKKQEHHLDEFYHINIEIFKEQYNKVAALMEKLWCLSSYLLNEYKRKTFTTFLSRSQIKEIAKALPPRSSWANSTFDDVKKDLKEKYDISNTAFSNALNIIQAHREFSSYIESIIPVDELTERDYLLFKEKMCHFHSIDHAIDHAIDMESYLEAMVSFLAPCAICSLRAFYEIGYFEFKGSFSEDYDSLVKLFLDKDSCETYLMEFINSRRTIEWIEKGMRICGQTHFFNNTAEVHS